MVVLQVQFFNHAYHAACIDDTVLQYVAIKGSWVEICRKLVRLIKCNIQIITVTCLHKHICFKN